MSNDENGEEVWINQSMVETWGLDGKDWPAFYHADDCPNYCDYSCGGQWVENQDELRAVAAARQAEVVDARFIVRATMFGPEREWQLDPGVQSEGVRLDEEGGFWWVKFPGGVELVYDEIKDEPDLFVRMSTPLSNGRNFV